MQRVLAISTLTDDTTTIFNPDRSTDSIAALIIAKSIACEISMSQNKIILQKKHKLTDYEWNVGESGLSARIFSAIAGLYKQDITITGQGTLLKRSMTSLISALEKAGLQIDHNEFKLPIKVKGGITNYSFDIDAQDGSQVLTGLLIALTQAEYDSEIKLTNLRSKPYIDITLCILRSFGAEIQNEDYKLFKIRGNQKLHGLSLSIEGDWSGAAFHLVGAAINGKVEIKNLNPVSKQGDRAILNVLQQVGAKIKKKHDKITVEKGDLKPFYFDATETPDLFPPLAALAANCTGISKIKGVSRLLNKESNRFLSIKSEFEKLGIKIENEEDNMVIFPSKAKGGIVDSHNDHRIAMALAILGLNSEADITIQNSDCISKSYPDFFIDFQKLGGEIVRINE
jgi:3-phosphoshikimate 1-carboxyvinyltransferase